MLSAELCKRDLAAESYNSETKLKVKKETKELEL